MVSDEKLIYKSYWRSLFYNELLLFFCCFQDFLSLFALGNVTIKCLPCFLYTMCAHVFGPNFQEKCRSFKFFKFNHLFIYIQKQNWLSYSRALFCIWISYCFLKLHLKKNFIYLFLDPGAARDKERERNINVWLPLMCSLLGTRPGAQACALDWELNWGPFDLQADSQPTEPHQSGL